MLKRKIYSQLVKWKHSYAKKALCIVGARQIGKSTVARTFGHNEYEVVWEINFIQNPEFKLDFSSSDPNKILFTLAAHLNQPLIDHKTLLILDEIQECPEARSAVKFLVENGRIDVLETGSLLGVNLNSQKSMPVGFEEILPMFPMDFEEFLWAVQTRQETIDYLKQCYQKKIPVEPALHEKLLMLFWRYMVVGGMPEVVQAYVDTQSIPTINRIQKRLMDLYRLDIMQYAGNDEKVKILDVFNAIPTQLDDKNRRFFLSHIKKSARMERYEHTFVWLELAGVGLPCYNVSELQIPLVKNVKRNLFRLYLCDTGLLTSCYSADIQYEILQGNIKVNFGSILENLFAQALRSKELPLFYYDNKRVELDFVVPMQNKIHLLEIKSGQDYTKHPSLSKMLTHPELSIDQGIVFCKSNVMIQENILYLPFYMVMFYENEKVGTYLLSQDVNTLFGL